MRRTAERGFRPGLALGALGLAAAVVLVQLARHPRALWAFAFLPGPDAAACAVRCLGFGPFLQVLAEAGRSAGLLILSGSFIFASLRTGLRLIKTWRFADRVARAAVPGEGLPGGALIPGGVGVLRERRPAAFTIGYWTPRVFVTTGLVDVLEPPELRAVLRHEDRHRRSRDPLKGLVASFLADALFFLPVSRILRLDYGLAAETAADDHAVALDSDPLDLASSLMKVRSLGDVAASWFADPTESRIRRLIGEGTAVRRSPARILASALLLALACWVALVPARKDIVSAFLDHDKVCALRTGMK